MFDYIYYIGFSFIIILCCKNSEDVDDAGDVKYNNDAEKDVTDKDSEYDRNTEANAGDEEKLTVKNLHLLKLTAKK